MNAPAEIYRRVRQDAAAVIVARGPLVIMAHGLMALAPVDRGTCWIHYAGGDVSPGEAEEALRIWQSGNC
ncbi:MAG: hypothetical protein EOP62_01515 [Sphingomonadales bacterium]|nr:MAG: hypothetical protein EOP62_01515 [Sphingomonadales bacterium]